MEDLLVALQEEHQFDPYELIKIPYRRISVPKHAGEIGIEELPPYFSFPEK